MTTKNLPDSREADPIRVIVADDHALVRTGLEFFLAAFEDLELVGEAGNGQEAVELCARLRPDVVLMDLLMPVMNGVSAIRDIRTRWPAIRILALTSFQETEQVQDALRAGAIGYLLKNVSADELAGAIRAAYTGQSTLAPEATQALVEAAGQPPPLVDDLTAREREVLALLAEGLSNPEIGERLTVSPTTAKFHVGNILSKLGVTSRTEAVALAIQQRLIP